MKEFLSYKNQSIDLLFRLNDWFLSDKDLHHERFKDTYFNKIGILIFWKIHLLGCFLVDGIFGRAGRWILFVETLGTCFEKFINWVLFLKIPLKNSLQHMK